MLFFLALCLSTCLRGISSSATCTLSTAGVEQVQGTLTTLTTDVTALSTAVSTLTTNVATLQTAVTAISGQTTTIDTVTTNTQTTVNAIAADLVVNADIAEYLATITPVAYSPMAAGYAGGIFGFTSGTTLPWSGTEFTATSFCTANLAPTIWKLDAAWNTAVTTAAFPLVVASVAASLPTAASYQFMVLYNDACTLSFTYGAITGTCCTNPATVNYVYSTNTGQFTCSDLTTPVFPLCAAYQTA
jgi:hypothetical protein